MRRPYDSVRTPIALAVFFALATGASRFSLADEGRHIDDSTPRACAMSAHVALLDGDAKSFRELLSETTREDSAHVAVSELFVEVHRAKVKLEAEVIGRYGMLARPLLERVDREPRASTQGSPLLSMSEMIIFGKLTRNGDTASIELLDGTHLRMRMEGTEGEWRVTAWTAPALIVGAMRRTKAFCEELLHDVKAGKYGDAVAMLRSVDQVMERVLF